MSVQEIIEAIEKMSLMEVNELVEALKEKFGVTGAIAVAGGAPAGAAANVIDLPDLIFVRCEEVFDAAIDIGGIKGVGQDQGIHFLL